MTIVCNAGPIIALAKIDHLPLLRDLAEQILIPEPVFHEVLAKPGSDSSRILCAAREFIEVQAPPARPDAAVLLASRLLDPGEKAVIALASTIPSPITALLDDAAGRKVASRLGIPVLGFVGLLLVAKERQLIAAVGPLVEQARIQGYWLSDELVEIARKLAHE
jgi:predicted nucleic acid-binding protein